LPPPGVVSFDHQTIIKCTVTCSRLWDRAFAAAGARL